MAVLNSGRGRAGGGGIIPNAPPSANGSLPSRAEARVLLAKEKLDAALQELSDAIAAQLDERKGGANWRRLVEPNAVGPAGIEHPGDEWVTAREAAEVARRSIDCIHLWRTEGKIRAHKRAGRWEVDLRSLRAHIKENRGTR